MVKLKDPEKLQRFKTREPFVKPGVYLLRPEDRNNPRMRANLALEYRLRFRETKPPRRLLVWTEAALLEPTHAEGWLHLHSPRWNFQPLLPLFMFGMWLGITAHYINHKLTAIEPAWVEDLGQDYPAKRRLWPARFFHYHRVASYHF